MKSVYKYTLTPNFEGMEIIKLPFGTKIIHADIQYGDVRIWALVDKNEKTIETRIFRTYGTGQNIDEKLKLKHIGSTIMNDGTLVWHVFEELN